METWKIEDVSKITKTLDLAFEHIRNKHTPFSVPRLRADGYWHAKELFRGESSVSVEKTVRFGDGRMLQSTVIDSVGIKIKTPGGYKLPSYDTDTGKWCWYTHGGIDGHSAKIFF